MSEHVLVTLFACSQYNYLHSILTELIHDIGDEIKTLLIRKSGYHAYHHDMTTNDFYYARPIGNKVQNTLEALRYDMENGIYDDSLLYVLGKDKLALYRGLDLHFYEIKGRYIASHEPIEGMQEAEV